MTPAIPSNFANAVAPFVPLGRQAVGQENEDLRTSTLKPLEESAESARGENRRSPDERAGEAGEQTRLNSLRDTDSDNASSRATESDMRASLERQRQVEDQKTIRELATRDREVRLHEQAHAAIGGRYAGAPRYEFERGPDGVSYAVAGEVPIDTGKIPNDPEATLQKAQQIRRAAYAPAEPSDTDRRVAAEATQMEAAARAELRQEQLKEAREQRTSSEEETSIAGNDDGTSASDQNTAKPDPASGDEPFSPVATAAAGPNAAVDTERDEAERQGESARGLSGARQRHVDTYLQLVELNALGDQALLGSRLNQRI